MTRARSRQAAGIKGVSQVRKTLRMASDRITADLRETIEDLAVETAEVMRAKAPRKEGDLVSSIGYVLSSDGLSAAIAPGIRGATTVKKRTGSHFTTVKIESGKAADLTSKTGKRIVFSARTAFDRFQFMKAHWLENGTKTMRRHRFVGPTRDAMSSKIRKGVGRTVDRALAKIARGRV